MYQSSNQQSLNEEFCYTSGSSSISAQESSDEPVSGICTICTYCGIETKELIEFFPHESGGYCIFMPRYKTEYACEQCAYKKM